MTSISCNPIIGREAFEKWLRIAFEPGETIWLKQGSTKFYQGEVGNDYRVSGWETQGDREKRWKVRFFDDLYVELERGALAGEEEGLGVYFIAGKPTDAPTKECCLGSNIIGFELDDGTDAEQWAVIERVAHLAGVTPNYLLTSGGKSNHGGYVLTEFVPPEKNKFYRQLLSIVYLSDPAVITQSQPLRTAGFYRAGKGKHQELRYTNEVKLTPQELEAAMQRCFAGMGFVWWSADQFSDERWRQVRRVLVNKHLSRQEKESQIRDVLVLAEKIISPPRQKPQPVADFQYSGETIPLEFFLSRENQRLLEAGQSEGDRDNAGFKVAKDLIGAAYACTSLGINYDGSARHLFEDFAARCSPRLGSRDVDRIWRSASRGTPKAALPDDAIRSRANFWHRQHNPQKRQHWDESADFYAAHAAEMQQWEEGFDQYLSTKRLESFLGKTLKQIKKFVSQAPKHLRVKGFGEAPVPQANTEGIVQFKAGDREKIISQIALQAKKDGRRAIILDSSEPGTGKSHNWGEMSNGVLGVDKLFYTSPGHRNPTVSTVESNCVDLHVRNNGLYEDESKQTALGNNHIRWAKTNKGEKPNLTGNCSRTPLFHTLSSKGYHAETSAAASINSICKTCEFAPGCAGVKDENGNLIMQPAPGNTYRSDRQEALAHPKIRCSLDSLPTIEALKEGDEQEGKEPQRVAIIVDEFHQQFRATNLTQVELTELDSTWAYFETRHLALQQEIQQIKSLVQQKRDDLETLEDKEQIRASAENIISLMRDLDTTQKLIQRLPGVLDAVRPIVHTLRLVIAGDLPTTQQTYHGWNENLLREEIGKLPEGLTEAIEVLSALNPKLSSLLDGTEADSVSQRGVEGSTKQKKESSATLKYIRKAFEKEAKQEAKDRLKSVPANWVVPVLKILNGSRGSFRVKNGTLEVVTPNHRHQEQLLAADLAVVLDATLSREELAENLGIDPSEIILIQQERQSYENLTVLQVVGMGKLTKNRSSELNSRLDALLEELDKKHPSNAVIDHLAVKRQGDGHWFADSRATNAYQDKTALITVGSPYMDIGSLAMVYSTMTGDKNAVKGNPRFDKFVQRFKESEMIQAGGRLRVHRRKEEQLFWYVVSDEDIGYLKSAFPGATFKEVSALSITPEAASESERTFSAIMQASAQIVKQKVEQEKFEKLNQAEIARVAGIAQGTVSKQFSKSKNELIAKVGGWTGFKKIFQALVSSYRDWNNFSKSLVEQLGEDAAHIAQTYLPQFLKENQHDIEAITSECVNMAQIVGWRAIQAFLHLMPHESRVNMLISLMEQLSEDWRMQFLEVWKCKLTLEAWVS
jgi:hypothetical protein